MTATNTRDRVFRVLLSAGTRTPGITPTALARKAGVSKNVLYRTVSALRTGGANIYSNSRIVRGEKQMFYRLAA